MNRFGALRALLRVEMRELRRHPGRSWLVGILVAVPVAAMVGGGALLATIQRTPEEVRAEAMGAGDLRVEGPASAGALRALLPGSARLEYVSLGRTDVRVPGRRLAARAYSISAEALAAGGLARGMLSITEGEAPSRPGEVALSPLLARGLARSIGDTVDIDGESARITGIVVEPEDLAMPVVLRGPGPPWPAAASIALLDVDDPGATARDLRSRGLRVTERSELGARDEFEFAAVFVVGGFGFFEAALVISAAFAVGMRRRQREIGLLGATGAPIGSLRLSLLTSAVVLASIGAAGGVALGITAAHALGPFLDGWNLRHNGDLELSIAHVAGAVVLGLAAATSAATLPAFAATRLPIRAALSGRRPITEGTRVWSAFGLLLLVSGLALVAFGTSREGGTAATSILAGSISAVLGLGASSPWLLGALARVAAPLPLAWRLAARDAGRFRARNGPVVTAVLAGMSISLMTAALVGSIEALVRSGPSALRGDLLLVDGPGAEDVAGRLSEELGVVGAAPLLALRAGGEIVRARGIPSLAPRESDAWIAVGDESLLHALDATAGVEALRAGRIVALAKGANSEPEAPLPGWLELWASAERKLGDFDVAWIEVEEVARAPLFVCGAPLLERLGLDAGPPPDRQFVPWAVRLGSTATLELVASAQDLAASVPGTTVDAALLHERAAGPILMVVLALCFITGIVVVFVATALSSVESASDSRVLLAVGAAPGTMRTHAAARAGYLAALGCALSIPAGLIPSYGLVALSSANLVFAVPWTEIAIVAFGLPALAFAGAWIHAALEPQRGRIRAARG